jgi:hypothetical protein
MTVGPTSQTCIHKEIMEMFAIPFNSYSSPAIPSVIKKRKNSDIQNGLKMQL